MCASLALQPEVKQMNKDIDFLVDLEAGRTLLDLGGLQYDVRAVFADSCGCSYRINAEE